MRTGDNMTTDSEPLNKRKKHDIPLWNDLTEKGESQTRIDTDYVPYVMESHTMRDYICFVPNAVVHSLRNMARMFGWTYLFSIFIVYGFQQGIGNAWFFQARDYYFKDIAQIQPADAQSYIAVSQTPWNLKPIYGMLSDSLPVYGYHRLPYIIFAGVIGLSCFFMLSSLNLGAVVAVVLLFGVNLSVASPDVMVDGLIAERARDFPKFATDLQSLCWGCMSICAICGYLTSGYMVTTYGSITMFRCLIVSPLVILTAGFLNWFGDVRKHNHAASSCTASASSTIGTCCCGLIAYDKSFVNNHGNLFFIGTFIPVLALLLSGVVMTFHNWQIRLITVLLVFVLVSISFFTVARMSNLPDVANAGLFIFLSNAITPDIETALFYWYTDSPEGPQFTPQFVGYISGIAFAAMFIGILLYNRYLSTWPYRSIFACTMFFLACMNLIDVVLVKRWNLQLGIPDEIMILGDSALSPMARRFYIMPLYILAAKVCPQGAEATVFALLTALGNFGSSISTYMGAFVLEYFDIRKGHFDNLVLVVLIKSVSRLLPILLIPFLVPHGSPYSEDEESCTPAPSSSSRSPLTPTTTSSPSGRIIGTSGRRKKVRKGNNTYENIDLSGHSTNSSRNDDDDDEIMLMPSWKEPCGGSSTHRIDRVKMSTI